MLRLDPNIFRADVPRGASVPAETTDGMVVTRLAVNGDGRSTLTAPAAAGGRGAAWRAACGAAARLRVTASR